MKLLKFRKGSFFDGMTFLIILFAFSLFFMVVYKALDDVNTDIQADPDINAAGKAIIDEYHTNYNTWFDNAFLFVFAGLWIAALIASFYIDSNPGFLIASIILLIVVLVAAAYLSNGYEEILSDSDFTGISAAFPVTHYVLTHIVEFLLGIMFTILLALFAKSRL